MQGLSSSSQGSESSMSDAQIFHILWTAFLLLVIVVGTLVACILVLALMGELQRYPRRPRRR